MRAVRLVCGYCDGGQRLTSFASTNGPAAGARIVLGLPSFFATSSNLHRKKNPADCNLPRAGRHGPAHSRHTYLLANAAASSRVVNSAFDPLLKGDAIMVSTIFVPGIDGVMSEETTCPFIRAT